MVYGSLPRPTRLGREAAIGGARNIGHAQKNLADAANLVVPSNPWTAFARGAVLPPTPKSLKPFLATQEKMTRHADID
jgi:hypothetical protein